VNIVNTKCGKVIHVRLTIDFCSGCAINLFQVFAKFKHSVLHFYVVYGVFCDIGDFCKFLFNFMYSSQQHSQVIML